MDEDGEARVGNALHELVDFFSSQVIGLWCCLPAGGLWNFIIELEVFFEALEEGARRAVIVLPDECLGPFLRWFLLGECAAEVEVVCDGVLAELQGFKVGAVEVEKFVLGSVHFVPNDGSSIFYLRKWGSFR